MDSFVCKKCPIQLSKIGGCCPYHEDRFICHGSNEYRYHKCTEEETLENILNRRI